MTRASLLMTAGVLAASLALGACTETTAIVHTAKQFGKGGNASGSGQYKVGNPYVINGRQYYPKEDYAYQEVGTASWYGPKFHGKQTANGETFDMNSLSGAHRTLPMPSWVRVTNLANGRTIKLRINDRGPFSKERILDVSRAAARALGFEGQGTARVRVSILADESIQAKRDAGGGDTPYVQRRVYASGASGSPDSRDDAQSAAVAAARTTIRSGVTAAVNAGFNRTWEVPAGGTREAFLTPVAYGAATQVASSAPSPHRVGTGGLAQNWVQIGAFANMANAEGLRAQASTFGPAVVAPVRQGDRVLYRVRLGPYVDNGAAIQALQITQRSGYPNARIVSD